jgi:hypothetical protein
LFPAFDSGEDAAEYGKELRQKLLAAGGAFNAGRNMNLPSQNQPFYRLRGRR